MVETKEVGTVQVNETEEQINETAGALSLVKYIYSLGLINKKTYDNIMNKYS